jgi:serine O-acetyltransferase
MFDGLISFLDSIKERDPAPRSRWEVLLYPGVLALGLHRVAHWLYQAELFFLARLINHLSRALTAIDIHPGAQIGRNFFIDHGFVVIGETAIIGHDVTMYQGAIISLGAAILGPITIGARARVGANAVVTKDVAEGQVVVGIPARPMLVDAREYQKGFVPYGTPCSERFDPQTQQLEILRCELETLRGRIAMLIDERDAARAKLAEDRERA